MLTSRNWHSDYYVVLCFRSMYANKSTQHSLVLCTCLQPRILWLHRSESWCFHPRFMPCARLLFYVVVWSLVNASAPGLSLAGCHRFEPGPLPNTFHLYHLYFNVCSLLFKKASHLFLKYINKFFNFHLLLSYPFYKTENWQNHVFLN